jgi:hypothetical protein
MCVSMQSMREYTLVAGGLLQPLPIPEGMWQDISMNFIEGLPKSEWFNSILVVVDRLSKYSHFIPLKHPFSAQQIAQVILDTMVRLHGIPRSIVSDRDRIFTSEFWKELFRLNNNTWLTSTAYHPQTDGQTNTPKKWKVWQPFFLSFFFGLHTIWLLLLQSALLLIRLCKN